MTHSDSQSPTHTSLFFFFFLLNHTSLFKWHSFLLTQTLAAKGVQKTEESKKLLQIDRTVAKISVWFQFSFYKN